MESQAPDLNKLSADLYNKKVLFIKPVHEISYNPKKNMPADMNASVSYVAVRGTNLGFNISLKKCSKPDCSEERAKYQNLSVQRSEISLTPKE